MAKDKKKSSGKEKRSSIIDAISDWIKLLALIVLVAEAVILVAMWQTPHDHSMYPIYPFIMVFLLLIVIVALIYDRAQERKSNVVSVAVGDKALAIDPDKARANGSAVDKNSYANSLLGYSIDLPTGKGWSEPKEISYIEYVNSIMIGQNVDEDQLRLVIKTNSPFGKMLLNANILEMQNGDTVSIGFDAESTTDAAEDQIKQWIKLRASQGLDTTEEEIEMQRKILLQIDGEASIAFAAKLNVMVLKKADMEFDYMDKGLPNLFLSLAMGSQEPLDSLMASEDNIFWVARTKLNNVFIDNQRHSNLYLYRLYQIFDGTDVVYMTMVQWSPQLESSVATWDSLKNSFESFKIKK